MNRIFCHYHSDMCTTDVWLPYQPFHILSKVYVHFQPCVFCHTVPSSYGLHVLCRWATVNTQTWGCGHRFDWAESNNKPRWQQLCLASRELCICDGARRSASNLKFIFPQGRISLTNVSERKDKMRLGMTLTSNPKDNSFVVRMPDSAPVRFCVKSCQIRDRSTTLNAACLHFPLVFQACGPLWSYECGSSYYSTGICSRVNASFKFSRTIAPAFQSKLYIN